MLGSSGRRWALALTAVIALGGPRHTASADDARAPASERPWRGALAAGGYLAVTGPARRGLVATAELMPGGALGRFGARLEARGLDGSGLDDSGRDDSGRDRGMLTAGVIYEAAAARPRLSLALHGEAGAAAPDARATVGGGVRAQLWIVGPLAVGLDTTATLILDGLDTELMLASALTLGMAR